jgi:hypothetical protein
MPEETGYSDKSPTTCHLKDKTNLATERLMTLIDRAGMRKNQNLIWG